MTTRVRRTLPAKLVFLGLFSFLAFTTGCEWDYYLKSAVHHTEMLSEQIPVEEALEKDSLSADDKRKLELTQEVRKFAADDLGLNVGKNYSKFIDLHGKPVTYVVSASQKWKLESYLWKFLFVGKVPYKGFYTENEAHDEAEGLKKKDLDVYVRGVGAFSTLGMMQDPVLSSMLSEDDEEIVDTLIHESVHATIYIKNSADFNEQMAVYLGGLGCEQFYRKREGEDSPTVRKIHDKKVDDDIFTSFMKAEAESLKIWYANQKTHDEGARQKQFAGIKERFTKTTLPQMKTDRYAHFFNRPLNNARILLTQTYMNDLSDFERFGLARGNDFRRILADFEKLKKSSDPAKDLHE